jgi:triosephosphate isomerase
MRRKIVAGNWKMNTTRKEGVELARSVAQSVTDDRIEVVVCPPFPYLQAVGEAIAGSKVTLGGQNCHDKPKGAFTGETSPAMLVDLGCKWVIIGHSERRHGLAESDSWLNQKVHAALGAGLHVMFCIGETQEERDAMATFDVCRRQIVNGLAGVTQDNCPKLAIAYEPVWAIGTGKSAKPKDAQEAHAFIRSEIQKCFGEKRASEFPILYGGSVDKDKAPELFVQPDIDGGLIGGASLKPEFIEIIQIALR